MIPDITDYIFRCIEKCIYLFEEIVNYKEEADNSGIWILNLHSELPPSLVTIIFLQVEVNFFKIFLVMFSW